MNKSQTFITCGVLALGIGLGCNNQEASKAALTELEGTWQSACYLSESGQAYRETYVFAGNTVSKTTTGFANNQSGEPQCGEIAYSLRQISKFNILENFEAEEEDVKTIDFETVEVNMTIFHKDLLDDQFCGLGDWRLGTPRDVSGRVCFEADALPEKGQEYFNIYQRKDGDLTFGEMESDLAQPMGFRTQGQRPETLDVRKFKKQ